MELVVDNAADAEPQPSETVVEEVVGSMKKKYKPQIVLWLSIPRGKPSREWEKMMAGVPFMPQAPPYRWSIWGAVNKMGLTKENWNKLWSEFQGMSCRRCHA